MKIQEVLSGLRENGQGLAEPEATLPAAGRPDPATPYTGTGGPPVQPTGQGLVKGVPPSVAPSQPTGHELVRGVPRADDR